MDMFVRPRPNIGMSMLEELCKRLNGIRLFTLPRIEISDELDGEVWVAVIDDTTHLDEHIFLELRDSV